MTEDTRGEGALTWEIGIPLATNRLMLRQYAMVSGLAGFLPLAALGAIMAFNGDHSSARAALVAGIVAAPVLFLLFAIISLVVLGNRLKVRYTVDGNGVRMQVIDRTGRAAARAALVVGLIDGKAGAIGAGLSAMGDEDRRTVWSAVASVINRPDARVIELRNEWRAILQIYCSDGNYGQVAETVQNRTSGTRKTDGLVHRHGNPLPKLLALSIAVVTAALPTFFLPWPFELNPLPSAALVAFGLATVWLLPPLAWGMIGAIAAILWQVLAIGMATHTSRIGGADYSGFHALNDGDQIEMVIAATGLIFLSWLAVRALKGKTS